MPFTKDIFNQPIILTFGSSTHLNKEFVRSTLISAVWEIPPWSRDKSSQFWGTLCETLSELSSRVSKWIAWNQEHLGSAIVKHKTWNSTQPAGSNLYWKTEWLLAHLIISYYCLMIKVHLRVLSHLTTCSSFLQGPHKQTSKQRILKTRPAKNTT